MYDSQDKIPVRDWLTIGVVLVVLVVIIFVGVALAENTSSSVRVVSGPVVTVSAGTLQAAITQKTSGTPQPADQQPGANALPAKDQKNINQMSFFEVFLLVLLGAAVFTVLVSVLIALLVIQLNRILRRGQKKPQDGPPGP